MWAVVTGSSDGIGAEFGRQLAEEGFNVVLVSRTLSKLEKVAKEIKEGVGKGVEVKVVQADFAGNANLSYYEELFKKILSQLPPQ